MGAQQNQRDKMIMTKIEEQPEEELTFRDPKLHGARAQAQQSFASKLNAKMQGQKVPDLRSKFQKFITKSSTPDHSFHFPTRATPIIDTMNTTTISFHAADESFAERGGTPSTIGLFNNSRGFMSNLNDSFSLNDRMRPFSQQSQQQQPKENKESVLKDINSYFTDLSSIESFYHIDQEKRARKRSSIESRHIPRGSFSSMRKVSRGRDRTTHRISTIRSGTSSESITKIENKEAQEKAAKDNVTSLLNRLIKPIGPGKKTKSMLPKEDALTKLTEMRKRFYTQKKVRDYNGLMRILHEVMQYSVRINSMVMFLSTLQLLAEIANIFRRYNEAVLYFNQLRIAGCYTHNNSVRITALRGLSEICKLMNNMKAAMDMLRLALQYAWADGSENQELAIYDAIGRVYFLSGDLPKAQLYHDRCMKGDLEPRTSAIRKKYEANYERVKGRFQKFTTLCYTFLSKFNLPIVFYIDRKEAENDEQYKRRDSISRELFSVRSNVSRSRIAYSLTKDAGTYYDDTVEVEPVRKRFEDEDESAAAQLDLILRDPEFEESLMTPRAHQANTTTTTKTTVKYKVYIGQRNYEAKKSQLLSRNGLVRENMKKSYKDKLESDPIADFQKIIEKNNPNQPGVREINGKCYVTHLSNSRNPPDFDLMFEHSGNAFERYFKELIKSLMNQTGTSPAGATMQEIKEKPSSKNALDERPSTRTNLDNQQRASSKNTLDNPRPPSISFIDP